MLFGHNNRPFLSTCSEPRNGVSTGKVKKNSAVTVSSSRHKNAPVCTQCGQHCTRGVSSLGMGGGQGSHSSASSSREESSAEVDGNKDHYSTSLEKAMATHSSTLAWKIPWVEGPGGLQSVGLQRVRHD